MHKVPMRVALVAAFVASLAPGLAAAAAPGFSLQASAFVDDDSGSSYDVNARFRPVDWLTLSIGAGQSSSSLLTTDFDGTSVHGGVDLQGSRFGGGLYANRWEDSDDFSSQVFGGRFSVSFAGSLEAALLLESRRLEVGYTTTGALGRTVAQRARFDGSGLGAELGWYGREWSSYVRGIAYDYDDQFDRLVSASRAPATRAFPQFNSLVNSILTRTAGAIDYQATIGIERAFARSGLGADVTLSSDAITGDDSTSLSVAWRYELTTRVGIDATLGTTSTDGLDAVGFAGLGFSFRN